MWLSNDQNAKVIRVTSSPKPWAKARSELSLNELKSPPSGFSRSGLISRAGYSNLQNLNISTSAQQLYDERSSETAKQNHQEERRNRPSRLIGSPYRVPFHASTASLPEIKEASSEENGSEEDNETLRHSESSLVMERKKDNARNERLSASISKNTTSPVIKKQAINTAGNIARKNQGMVRNPYNDGREASASLVAVNISDPKYLLRQLRDPYSVLKQQTSKGRASTVDFDNEAELSSPSSPGQQKSTRDLMNISSDQNRQPKSILKQKKSIQKMGYSDGENETSLRTVGRMDESDRKYKSPDKDSENRAAVRDDSPSCNEQNELQTAIQRNLLKQKQRSRTPQIYPQASFDGPFFTLQEVRSKQHRAMSAAPSIQSFEGLQAANADRPDKCNGTNMNTKNSEDSNGDGGNLNKKRYGERSKSVSVVELNKHRNDEEYQAKQKIMSWSPSTTGRARSVPPSTRTKNITDPDFGDKYQRQKEMELEAIKRHEEEAEFYRQKQMQRQKFYEQQGRPVDESNIPFSESREELQQIDINARLRQEQYPDDSPVPEFIRVYETRPISADIINPGVNESAYLPTNATWKRIYIVNRPKPTARNEILTSEQVLERERFHIDLLQRREAFIEKPKSPTPIYRTGKRWQPPPEQPYLLYNTRRHYSSDVDTERSDDLSASSRLESNEYKWQPVLYDPVYKQECKRFTPENSPPETPRGFGPGPLDEPAKRQTRYLVQPTPDGSHRPKPIFGGPRVTPSGGFYPHAPNAIKVLKKKQDTNSLDRKNLNSPEEQVKVIHHNYYHRLGEPSTLIPSSSRRSEVEDWEKIYDLPPHSSTITGIDRPRNVDVRRKLAAFEDASRRFFAINTEKRRPHTSQGLPITEQRTTSSDSGEQQLRYEKRSSTPSVNSTIAPRRAERGASVIDTTPGNAPVHGQTGRKSSDNHSETLSSCTSYNRQQHTSLNSYESKRDLNIREQRKDSRNSRTPTGSQHPVGAPLRLTRISINADSRTQSPSSHSSPCISSLRSPRHW